ncbi:unnamed protein product [Blepharisma stoltei]|uniref:Acyltransferase 3 domain-containing protein n=1 Tax=Blepharisma stoltei TaxID=1481888 RepID=A0AAU9JNF9_9CILI|nr:unnamed protein product [Blepharisma stoltei]
MIIIIGGVAIGITIAAEYNFKANILDPNMDFRTWDSVYYKKPWTRFLPYFIGVLIGFVYLRYTKLYVNKEEDTHNDPACTLIIKNIRNTKFGAIISFCVGLAIILFLILIQRQLYRDLTNSNVWTSGENAVFIGTCRLGFAIGLAMILLPLLLGRLRFIYKILTFRFWGYLAKISYAVYLCHMSVIVGFFGNTEGSTIISEMLFVKYLIILSLASWPAALILWLIVEEPSSLLERLLMSKLIKKIK